MTREPLNRKETQRLYRPTVAEERKATRLLKKLTPSDAAYRQYRLLVNAYLHTVAPTLRHERHEYLRGVRLRESELFPGREFLVATVDDSWLRKLSPNLEAAASPMAGSKILPEITLPLPPFVYVPESKRRSRSRMFHSILEHEFVHICQAIQGKLIQTPEAPHADDLFRRFFVHLAAEYEANYIQLVRWPDVFSAHTHNEVELELWCLLRGYGPALESSLTLMAMCAFPDPEVREFLVRLSKELPGQLSAIGARKDLVSWIASRFDNHLQIALEEVLTTLPEPKGNAAFISAVRWWQARVGKTQTHRDR